MVAAEREIMFNLTTQYKLGVLQWFIVVQPVQLCPLCRGVAVLVLDSDAVDGKRGSVLEPEFQPEFQPQPSSQLICNAKYVTMRLR